MSEVALTLLNSLSLLVYATVLDYGWAIYYLVKRIFIERVYIVISCNITRTSFQSVILF